MKITSFLWVCFILLLNHTKATAPGLVQLLTLDCKGKPDQQLASEGRATYLTRQIKHVIGGGFPPNFCDTFVNHLKYLKSKWKITLKLFLGFYHCTLVLYTKLNEIHCFLSMWMKHFSVVFRLIKHPTLQRYWAKYILKYMKVVWQQLKNS